MKTESEESKTTAFSLIMKFMGMIMAVVYIILGALVIWSELFHVPDQYSLPLGSMLMAYGFFRTYRNYTKYFKKG